MPAVDPRAVLSLIIILFIIFSPAPTPTLQSQHPAARVRFQDTLLAERHALDILNSSKWGDFRGDGAGVKGRSVNLTGLEAESKFAWGALDGIKERAKVRSAYALGLGNIQDGGEEGGEVGENEKKEPVPLYQNISGVVHGDWVRSPLQDHLMAPVFNMSQYSPDGPFGPVAIDSFERNLTEKAREGWMSVTFSENDSDGKLLQKDFVEINGTEVRKNLLRSVRASVHVTADDSGEDWEAHLFGVHFLETGNMLFATTSDKFAGVFALPHFTSSETEFFLSQELLNRTLHAVIERQDEGVLHVFNPWSSVPEGREENAYATPKCELLLYIQQHPVPLPASTLPLIEAELRDPTGAFPPPPSDLHFSLLAFSPDCGYVLESKGPPDYAPQEGEHLIGIKEEVEWLRARHHVLLYSLVLFLQILLLKRQMKDASTPSTRSRISFYTIAMQAMGDGYTTMSLWLISLSVPSIGMPSIGTAFLSFMGVSFFGMRFLLDIHTVQAPERQRAERARLDAAVAASNASRLGAAGLAPTAVAAPAVVGNLSDGLTTPTSHPLPPPLPPPPPPPPPQDPIITAAGADVPIPARAPPLRQIPIDTGATPIFIPSDQDLTHAPSPPQTTLPTTERPSNPPPQPPAAGFGALYARFYLLLLFTLFLSLNASTWPPPFRRLYFTTLAFAYLSFWLPQIHRNTRRNCRRAFRWDFTLGQSVLRLVPFVYFYGYAKNVVFASVDAVGLAVLIGWMWMQVLVLVSQDLLGPRWFLLRRWEREWVPVAFDYHPVLREDEEGGNLPVGAAEAFAAADAGAGAAVVMSPVFSPRAERKKGLTGAQEDEVKHGRRTFDCAICMCDLEVAVVEDKGGGKGVGDDGSGVSLLERRKYMVTPCRHIFHSDCLEGWMKYRLQCPVCREELPPV